MIVHVLGNSVDMDKLLQIKKKYNLILVEDICESLGTKYKKIFRYVWRVFIISIALPIEL